MIHQIYPKLRGQSWDVQQYWEMWERYRPGCHLKKNTSVLCKSWHNLVTHLTAVKCKDNSISTEYLWLFVIVSVIVTSSSRRQQGKNRYTKIKCDICSIPWWSSSVAFERIISRRTSRFLLQCFHDDIISNQHQIWTNHKLYLPGRV